MSELPSSQYLFDAHFGPVAKLTGGRFHAKAQRRKDAEKEVTIESILRQIVSALADKNQRLAGKALEHHLNKIKEVLVKESIDQRLLANRSDSRFFRQPKRSRSWQTRSESDLFLKFDILTSNYHLFFNIISSG